MSDAFHLIQTTLGAQSAVMQVNSPLWPGYCVESCVESGICHPCHPDHLLYAHTRIWQSLNSQVYPSAQYSPCPGAASCSSSSARSSSSSSAHSSIWDCSRQRVLAVAVLRTGSPVVIPVATDTQLVQGCRANCGGPVHHKIKRLYYAMIASFSKEAHIHCIGMLYDTHCRHQQHSEAVGGREELIVTVCISSTVKQSGAKMSW